MGGEFADFAYAQLNDFDYAPYVSAMQAAATPGTVESTPPTLAILNQQTTGNVVSLSGTAQRQLRNQGRELHQLVWGLGHRHCEVAD